MRACGICRTDLHVVDGELTGPKLPLIPGHQIVGVVAAAGSGATRYAVGRRIGVPWLAGSCGRCNYCRSGRENLCDHARYTGYQMDGGYADFCVADERFCFPIPEGYPDLQAAPLLCAGLIGYRSLRMTGDARLVGFYGFGAAALPTGKGVLQNLTGGIYTVEYIKENGKWRIHKLMWNPVINAPPAEGWVKPERVAAATPGGHKSPRPDKPRDIDTRYPSGYIPPFHYPHPVTGKKTSERRHNASLHIKGID